MKKLIKYMMLFLCILLMTGCSNKKSVGGKISLRQILLIR